MVQNPTRGKYECSSAFLAMFLHALIEYKVSGILFGRHGACRVAIGSVCNLMNPDRRHSKTVVASSNSIAPHGTGTLQVQIHSRRPMERRKFLELLGSGAALSGPMPDSLSSLGDEGHAQGAARPTTILQSADRFSTDTAAAIYNRHKVEGTKEWIRRDIEVYRVTYKTRDIDGSEVVASGAVLGQKTSGPPGIVTLARTTMSPSTLM